MNYIDKLRDRYFSKIRYSNYNFSSRNRKDVMVRNAFMTACRGVFTTNMIAQTFDKNHATVVHATSIHESNSKFSAEYREYYLKAKEIITTTMTFQIEEPIIKPLSPAKIDMLILEKELRETQVEVNELRRMVLSLRSKIDVIE
jgi:hypothetical protein